MEYILSNQYCRSPRLALLAHRYRVHSLITYLGSTPLNAFLHLSAIAATSSMIVQSYLRCSVIPLLDKKTKQTCLPAGRQENQAAKKAMLRMQLPPPAV